MANKFNHTHVGKREYYEMCTIHKYLNEIQHYSNEQIAHMDNPLLKSVQKNLRIGVIALIFLFIAFVVAGVIRKATGTDLLLIPGVAFVVFVLSIVVQLQSIFRELQTKRDFDKMQKAFFTPDYWENIVEMRVYLNIEDQYKARLDRDKEQTAEC